ncbi:MAG: RNA polymerase factor sigma-54 [Planctomycetes bacterium]|jgi:RNA polymerase sigma-54 factor|nr:RNA polymerase factor sigma-54 [Planctomycetota bacterium]
MRFDTSQQMRIDQRMKLAPRMIQSMEILQMPQAALEERIEQELASNPTLELREPGADRDALRQEREQTERDDRESTRELVVSDDPEGRGSADDFERLTNLSESYGESYNTNTFESGESYTGQSTRYRDSGERDGKMDAMANTAARGASLFEQLLDQWRMAEAPPDIAAAGEYLIGYIDADGYLRTPRHTLIEQSPPGMTEEAIDAAIPLMQQTFDPPGLAARDLRECLLLQIDAALRIDDPEETIADPDDLKLARTLVADHLKDIEANRYPQIAKAVGESIERVKEAVKLLRRFHPHPGRLLAEEDVRVITPDAIVEYDEENDAYTARLTHGRLPALHISRRYEKLAKNKEQDKRTRDFIAQNLRSANWLIDAIQQRNATLLRVIGVVLEAQREFLEQGPQALRPLPMTSVADQLGIHVATVSRAVSEKYIQTPRGIFPLRMFFSGGTESAEGEAMSWAAVQAKLEAIINEEDKSNPLSDDALVEKLKEQGIDIARRTVAKYRKQLNIPTARQRKEY